MIRNWSKICLLCLAAVILNIGLTQYRTNVVVTRGDGTVTQSIGTDPIITTSMSVMDMFCAQRPCIAAVARTGGFYGRDGVPTLLALIGGIVVPLMLAISALYLLLVMSPNWLKLSVAIVFVLIGTAAFFLIGAGIWRIFASQNVPLANLMRDGSFLFVGLTAVIMEALGLRLLWTTRAAT